MEMELSYLTILISSYERQNDKIFTKYMLFLLLKIKSAKRGIFISFKKRGKYF
jgi:hypothetical protein